MKLSSLAGFVLVALLQAIRVTSQNNEPMLIQSTLDGCFFQGHQSFTLNRNDHCLYEGETPSLEPSLAAQCKHKFREGCLFAQAQIHCQQGEQIASEFECPTKLSANTDYPQSYHQRCCEQCKQAQNYYDNLSTCPPPKSNNLLAQISTSHNFTTISFEQKAQEMLQATFGSCCAKQRNKVNSKRASKLQAYIEEEDDQQFVDRCRKSNRCDHLCIDTGEPETECSCNVGYVLANNGFTCLKLNPCKDYECPTNTRCEDNAGVAQCIPSQNTKRNEFVFDDKEAEPQEQIAKRSEGSDTSANGTLTSQSSTKPANQTKDFNKFKCLDGVYDPYTKTCVSSSTDTSNPTVLNITDKYESFCNGSDCDSEVITQKINEFTNCSDGFNFNAAIQVCEDIDECVDAYSCPPGYVCINKLGTFRCTPETNFVCDAGYQKVNNRCLDVNECEQKEPVCDTNQRCVNSLGSFKCFQKQVQTEPSVTKSPLSKVEATIQPELATIDPKHDDFELDSMFNLDIFKKTNVTIAPKNCSSNPCPENKKCIEEPHGYHCVRECEPGFMFNSVSDKCVHELDCRYGKRCDPTFDCILHSNLTHSCVPACQPGFRRDDTNPAECVDVDECQTVSLNTCSPLISKCKNTIGSFECECLLGYRQSSSNKTSSCVDIDECKEKLNVCSPSAQCFNTPGSFDCKCGHKSEMIKGLCVDINECSDQKLNPCPGKCINEPNGYICHICPFGFDGNVQDRSCNRVDHCSGNNKCLPGQQCISLTRTHRCVDTTCPDFYTFQNSSSRSCLLDRGQVRRRFKKTKLPYSLTHQFLVIPNSFDPKTEKQSVSYLYLLQTDHPMFEQGQKVYSYTLGIDPTEQLNAMQTHLQLKPENATHLSLSVIKPIPGPVDWNLYIDLTYKKKILQRKYLHLFVDEKN